MTGIDVIKAAMNSTQFMLDAYVADLSDADLLVRPAPGANNTAWQLGHMITAEVHLIRDELPDAVYPALPAGFAEKHGKATATSDDPSGFLTQAEYVSLQKSVRAATLATLGGLTDADLDRPTRGRLKEFAPRLGDVFLLVSNHTLMHGGQFTVVRRKLGKPVVF